MVAAVIGLTLLAFGALAYLLVRVHRLKTAFDVLNTGLAALGSCAHKAVDDLAHNQRLLEARQDRLQRMVTDRGWKDSMMLTRFDWRDPKDRG